MNTSIGVAIIGFAHGHVGTYCDEWRKEDCGVCVVAGWDRDRARLEKAQAAYGLAPYDNIAELLARPDVQAVVIGSETSLHAELVEQAAAAGKTIVVQKPLALTMAEADRIVDAVNKHNVPFTVAWQMRVDPQNAQMKQWMDSGRIGKLFQVRRRHGLAMGLQPSFADSWHVDPAYNRDIWADDSAHPIDLIHYWFGVPDSVTAEIDSLYNPRIPMDNGIAIFRYNGGPIVEVNCSFTCNAAESTTEIIGERGTIVHYYGDAPSCNTKRYGSGASLRFYDAATADWVESDIQTPVNHSYRIRGLAKPLAEFMRGERPPLATAEQSRISLQMVLATYASAQQGKRVTLDDPLIRQL